MRADLGEQVWTEIEVVIRGQFEAPIGSDLLKFRAST
jgi:hypothetical protein